MIYTIPCQTGAGCSCGELPCTLCNGYTDLVAFAEAYNFPSTQTPDASFPFSYSGSSLTGITNWQTSDVISTGGYLIRSTCVNTGSPLTDDEAIIYFNVIKSNVTVSYEYFLQDTGCVSGGKHRVVWLADPLSSSTIGQLQIGSWSNNSSNTQGFIRVEANYDTTCQIQQPPPEIPDFILPQTKGEWRTRTIVKNGDNILFTDGDVGPISLTRCWFPLNGAIGLLLGPGVRVRNITISI